jgi:Domain of unknown function (DUF397)
VSTTIHKPGIPAARGWFKSSWSTPNGECVEINFDHHDDQVHIRDSKDRGDGPTISIAVQQWTIMLDELTGDAPAGSNGAVTVSTSRSGHTLLRAVSDGTTLRFTNAEWGAFLAGARVHEFDHPGTSR